MAFFWKKKNIEEKIDGENNNNNINTDSGNNSNILNIKWWEKTFLLISELFTSNISFSPNVSANIEFKNNFLKYYITSKNKKIKEEELNEQIEKLWWFFEIINLDNTHLRLVSYDLDFIQKIRKKLVEYAEKYIYQHNLDEYKRFYKFLKNKNVEISEDTFNDPNKQYELIQKMKNLSEWGDVIEPQLITDFSINYIYINKKIFVNSIKKQLEQMYNNEKILIWNNIVNVTSYIAAMKKKIENNEMWKKEMEEEAEKFVNAVLLDLVKNKKASDIHLHGYSWFDKKSWRISYRALWQYRLYIDNIHFQFFRTILSNIWQKAWFELKLDEYQYSGVIQNFPVSIDKSVNFRCEAFQSLSKNIWNWDPVSYTVLRTLDGWWAPILEDLWYDENFIRTIRTNLFQNTQWIIIVSWPTWSGKSTLLYSVLQEYAKKFRWNTIYTIENPIEKDLNWRNIVQMEVDPSRNMEFKVALKALMRMDPDVILVWEIRDSETANAALEASKTWHLTFATLHVNNSIEISERLQDLIQDESKIKELAYSLKGAIAQRLVPLVCTNCWQKLEPELFNIEMQEKKNVDYSEIIDNDMVFYKKWPWCAKCNWQWIKWRYAVVELINYNKPILSKKELYKYLKYWIDFKSMFEYALDGVKKWKPIEYSSIIQLYDNITDIRDKVD